ncbi:MAG: hypothetical protein WCA91_21375 [Candidatus Acidiferrales bacterium]
MTDAVFRLSRFTIARKTSGVNVLIYLLKATHGPQNTPPVAMAQALHHHWWRFHAQI